MADNYQDGTHAYGVPDSPITIDAVVYPAEDITIEDPSSKVQIRNPSTNKVSGERHTVEPRTGTARLQLATAATAIPTTIARDPDMTFTLAGVSGVTWKIENVSRAYQMQGYTYVTISFAEKIN